MVVTTSGDHTSTLGGSAYGGGPPRNFEDVRCAAATSSTWLHIPVYRCLFRQAPFSRQNQKPKRRIMELEQLESVEAHIRSLEAAYERERDKCAQVEKKYARLKRRFARLERSHHKLLEESQVRGWTRGFHLRLGKMASLHGPSWLYNRLEDAAHMEAHLGARLRCYFDFAVV